MAHYLQALEVQRYANKIVSTLGSKTPHIQNLAVGGVSNPINTDSQSVLTVERLLLIKEMMDELGSFIRNCYQVDVAAVGAFYSDWTGIGTGITDYLSVPDIPLDDQGHQIHDARRLYQGRRPVDLQADHVLRRTLISATASAKSVKHSWYKYSRCRVAAPLEGRDRRPITRTSRMPANIPG